MPKKNIQFTLDGVGIKQAGELMISEPSTHDVRRKYPAVYRQTLLDLCHALFFGEKLKVNPTLYSQSQHDLSDVDALVPLSVQEKEDRAGLILLQILRKQTDRIVPYEPVAERGPDVVLKNEDERKVLYDHIRTLNTDYLNSEVCRQFWYHLLERDYIKYGTPTPQIDGPEGNPNSYMFKKYYMQAEELPQLLNDSICSDFAEIVRNCSNGPNKAEVASAFAQRVILTHLAIYENYKYQVSIMASDGSLQYIPCQTRSSLTFHRQMSLDPARDCQRVVAPHVLFYILKRCPDANPREFFLRLCDFVESAPKGWGDVQKYGRELYTKTAQEQSVTENDIKKLRKLVEDTERERGFARMINGIISLFSFEVEFNPQNASTRIKVRPQRHVAEYSADPNCPDPNQEIEKHLKRVFPDTFAN